MWGFPEEEMEAEVNMGVLNSAGRQGSSHECLHDHERVRGGRK